jgi:hypothetical protein
MEDNQHIKNAPNMQGNVKQVSSVAFYEEYHGHTEADLEVVHRQLRTMHSSIVFLAGDSSLDNKVWFNETARAVNGYESILNPPKSKQDISYWMNFNMETRQLRGKLAALNCSVEESTIGSRSFGRMWPQDKFIRDNIQENDILVISVGGNDVALRPAPCTIFSVASLVCCATTSCLKQCSCGCAIPVEDYTCCGALSNLCAFPCGMGYMVHLFGERIRSLVTRLIAKRKPKLVFICMIYFLDENPKFSWAGRVLSGLGYDAEPAKLQEAIKQIFRLATQKISIPGTTVVAVPLFEVLDGKNSTDYVQRVEPSATGGAKMGAFLVDKIVAELAVLEQNNGNERSKRSGVEMGEVVER